MPVLISTVCSIRNLKTPLNVLQEELRYHEPVDVEQIGRFFNRCWALNTTIVCITAHLTQKLGFANTHGRSEDPSCEEDLLSHTPWLTKHTW